MLVYVGEHVIVRYPIIIKFLHEMGVKRSLVS